MGIVKAAQKAADVTGASMYSIRNWAAMYFVCMISAASEEMDTIAVKISLSSDRGKGVKTHLATVVMRFSKWRHERVCASKQQQKG